MKLFRYFLPVFALCLFAGTADTQEYKLKQTNSVSGMKLESTIYVKGKRKRTEGGGAMGINENLVTIEQCDLQRTIKLNTKKKLYFIEPFADEEVIDEEVKAAVDKKPATQPKTTKKGGTMTMYYNITDTGERKKMYGFTARRIWTTQRIIPSANACYMKDSFRMKTDGWYIDLPEWNCPIRYRANAVADGGGQKPDCMDKYVTRTSGKGKLGFPLVEKRTIYMSDGKGSTTEMVTELNTVEFTSTPLDSMLFTIPPGYTETKNEADLQDAFDMNAYIEQMKKQQENRDEGNDPVAGAINAANSGDKPEGTVRIGIYQPTGEGDLPGQALQNHLVLVMHGDKIQSIAVKDEAEAREKQCDYVLDTRFTRMKQASKVGGIIKAIKNTDPNAASSWNIDAEMKLTALGDGSVKSVEQVSGKFSGQADAAAKGALTEGGGKLLRRL